LAGSGAATDLSDPGAGGLSPGKIPFCADAGSVLSTASTTAAIQPPARIPSMILVPFNGGLQHLQNQYIISIKSLQLLDTSVKT